MAEAEGLSAGCADADCGIHEEDFLLSDIGHKDGGLFVRMSGAPVVFLIPRNGDVGARG